MRNPDPIKEAPAALRINGLNPQGVYTRNAAPYKGVYGQRDKDEHGYWQYQHELDGSKWLCYAAKTGYWMLQSEANKGTTRGRAHTVTGEHSAPWDRDARWMEYDGNRWLDAPDVVVTVYATAAEADAAIKKEVKCIII